jgi:hypothetical protein
MKNPLHRPMENLIRGLDEHSEHLSAEEIHEELKACGVDIETTLKRTRSLIASSLKKERTAWMKVADSNRAAIDAASRTFVSWIGRGESEIRAAFEAFTSGLSEQQALAFHNRKDLSVDEMAQILDDFEKVRQSKEPLQS